MSQVQGVLTRIARVVRRRTFPAAVLLYHRIADLETDPWDLAVSPASFEGHLAVVRRRFRPVSLRGLLAELAAGRLEPGSVAVTFDDGYADNLATGKQLLERYAIPATVFVVTGALESGAEFWWDQLERVVLVPEIVPATLAISIGGREFTWELGSSARWDDRGDGAHRRWRTSSGAPTLRHALYRKLWTLLRPLPEPEREAVLAELRQWADVPDEARSTHRTLSTDEARELARGNLVELGAHTVTHPVLASLTVEEQRAEMGASKRVLEQLIERPVTQLSYPFGRPGDYSRPTVSIARELGFEIACTNVAAGVNRRTRPLELPRVYVRDGDPEAFEASISRWLGVT